MKSSIVEIELTLMSVDFPRPYSPRRYSFLTSTEVSPRLNFFKIYLTMNKYWPVPEWISTYSYKQSPRSFGSRRPLGRVHAGCDLYAPLGSPVLAITSGRVVESRDFYLGTFQVTIDHGAIGVVRYGEVSPDGIPHVGAVVEAGQQIGKIGNLGKGLHPMLHIEHFSGAGSGAMTNTNNPPYSRRSDLQDCSKLLDSLLCLREKTCK